MYKYTLIEEKCWAIMLDNTVIGYFLIISNKKGNKGKWKIIYEPDQVHLSDEQVHELIKVLMYYEE